MRSIAALCRFARGDRSPGSSPHPLQMPAVAPIRLTTAEGGAAVPRGGLGRPADNGGHLRGCGRPLGRCRGPPGGAVLPRGRFAGTLTCVTRQLVPAGEAVASRACPTCLTGHGRPGSRRMARHACSGTRGCAPGNVTHPLQMPAIKNPTRPTTTVDPSDRRARTPRGTGIPATAPLGILASPNGPAAISSGGRRAQRGPKQPREPDPLRGSRRPAGCPRAGRHDERAAAAPVARRSAGRPCRVRTDASRGSGRRRS